MPAASARLGVAAGLALLVAGCLGAATGPGPGAGPELRRGRAVWARSCASCHTLAGRERGAPGGDLAVGRLSVADLVSFARTMPVSPPLDAADADAVARYVHAVQRRPR